MRPDIDPLFNVGEVAKVLNCGKSTVWRLVAQGKLPAPKKIGGLVRWPKSELMAFIQSA